MNKLYNKVANLVIEQGLLVILLVFISGYLAYDKVKIGDKIEQRMIKMEIKIDTLQKQNLVCIFENNRCADEVRRLEVLLSLCNTMVKKKSI